MNARQKRFVEECVRLGNPTEAYAVAYGCDNRVSAGASARKLLANPLISSAVEEGRRKAEEERRERDRVTDEWLTERFKRNELAAFEAGKFSDSNRALELLGKRHGYFPDGSRTPDLSVVSPEGTVTLVDRIVIERTAVLAAARRNLVARSGSGLGGEVLAIDHRSELVDPGVRQNGPHD